MCDGLEGRDGACGIRVVLRNPTDCLAVCKCKSTHFEVQLFFHCALASLPHQSTPHCTFSARLRIRISPLPPPFRLILSTGDCAIQDGSSNNLCPPRGQIGSRVATLTSNITSKVGPWTTAHPPKHHHPHSRRSAMYRQEEKCSLG